MEGDFQSIQTEIKNVAPDQRLFKIFGHALFSFQKAYAPSLVDWSGFYTQLNPEHSLRYLTKKWDDGADYGCLVLLKPIRPIRTIKICNTQIFSNPKTSGKQKANILKQTLKKLSQSQKQYEDYRIEHDDILLKYLGQKQTILECIDMDENEIIIPHEMLNEKYFTYQTLIVFKKSNDGLLRTIGWCKGSSYLQNDSSWTPIKGESQFEPHLILKQDYQIKQMIQNIIQN